MKMKTVIWTGPQRQLCGYGLGEEGQTIVLPERIADSYIQQGLAKPLKKPTKLETEGED